MPPKSSKGSSKTPAKAKAPTDGSTKEELSREQLEEQIVRLQEELDREREERNYFLLERDKMPKFLGITERKLEEVKAEKKNFDKELEEDEGRHQVKIKMYKQKMKYPLYEHQNTTSRLKAGGLVAAQVVQEEQEQLETELHEEMRAIMEDMQNLDNETLVKEFELKYDEEITKTSNRVEKKIAETGAQYDENKALRRQKLDNMTKNKISEKEDQWNNHVNTLVEDHKKTLTECEAFWEEERNVNNSLKELIQLMKTQKEKKEDPACLLLENKQIAELLSDVSEENAEIEKEIKYFVIRKDVDGKAEEKKLDKLKRDYETLEQTFCKLELERDELYKSFTRNIQRVQHEADWKSTALEEKLKGLTDNLEKTQAQLLSVLSAPNMDRTALRGVTDTIEKNLDSSNDSIKNLEYKKAQLSQAHKDLLLTYEAWCGGDLREAI